MTKEGILIRKLWKCYKKKKNWAYSLFKGYPEGTFFGYESFAELKRCKLRDYREAYGKGLKKYRLEHL